MAVVCPIGEKKRSLEGFELEMGQDVKGIFFFFSELEGVRCLLSRL